MQKGAGVPRRRRSGVWGVSPQSHTPVPGCISNTRISAAGAGPRLPNAGR